jgi:branched-chain amino acid aminotransferase
VVPIREYDSRIIGSGKRGPVATALQSAYFDLVRGKSDKYSHWLAPVAE